MYFLCPRPVDATRCVLSCTTSQESFYVWFRCEGREGEDAKVESRHGNRGDTTISIGIDKQIPRGHVAAVLTD
jgi:hypothetical protein